MMPPALIHVLFDVVTRDNDRDRARRAATRATSGGRAS